MSRTIDFDMLRAELNRRPSLRIRCLRARRILRESWHLLRREPVYAWQRARRGYSEADTYSFDSYLAPLIAGGLRRLRERSLGYPMGMSEAEWDEVLDAMIEGFDLASDKFASSDPAADPRVQRAFALFSEHFFSLWD